MRIVVSCVLVVFLMGLICCAGRVASHGTPISQPHASQHRIRELSRTYSGTIDAHTTGRSAIENLKRADSLMAQWGAINFTLDDVRTLFGSPTTESTDIIAYRFDDGFGGAIWQFRAEIGRVVAVERVPLE